MVAGDRRLHGLEVANPASLEALLDRGWRLPEPRKDSAQYRHSS
jgi:hypothetical protein